MRNDGKIIDLENKELYEAFTHYSYDITGKKYMLTDL